VFLKGGEEMKGKGVWIIFVIGIAALAVGATLSVLHVPGAGFFAVPGGIGVITPFTSWGRKARGKEI
jgi:hypothetical protein